MNETMNSGEVQNPKMNPVNKLIGIFSNPTAVFANLKEHPEWLIPILLSVIIVAIFAVTTLDLQIAMQKEAIYSSTLIPEEAKDQAIERLDTTTPTAMMLQSLIGGIVSVIIIILFVALVFWVSGNFILGGQATFKQVLSMYAWGSMIGLLETIVKLPLMLQKGTMEVYTSLAVVMDASQSKTVLFQILNGFDLFSIWKVVLWSIGFSVLYKFSKGKSYGVVITLYVIYLMISIGFAQLFQGFMG